MKTIFCRKSITLLLLLCLSFAFFTACLEEEADGDEKTESSNSEASDIEASEPESSVPKTSESEISVPEVSIPEISEPESSDPVSEPEPECEIGDMYVFGSYEQDNDLSNGKEEIQWIILDKNEKGMLLISQYALDCKQFNPETSAVITWSNCELRSWLNETFINEAFSAEEQKKILETDVTEEKYSKDDVKSGDTVQDRVFLLSITEAGAYFYNNTSRCCVPTEYAIAQGVMVTENTGYYGCCRWWLRSYHRDSIKNDYVALTAFDGRIGNSFDTLTYISTIAVRPALWVELP